MSQACKTSLIGQIYLIENYVPEAESRRIAEFFGHYHANFFGPRTSSFGSSAFNSSAHDTNALSQEIEAIRKQFRSPQERLELPGEAPLLIDADEMQQLKLAMDSAWGQLPYVEREELKWKWIQGVPGVATSSSEPDGFSPARNYDLPPPYTMAIPNSKYPQPEPLHSSTGSTSPESSRRSPGRTSSRNPIIKRLESTLRRK